MLLPHARRVAEDAEEEDAWKGVVLLRPRMKTACACAVLCDTVPGLS